LVSELSKPEEPEQGWGSPTTGLEEHFKFSQWGSGLGSPNSLAVFYVLKMASPATFRLEFILNGNSKP